MKKAATIGVFILLITLFIVYRSQPNEPVSIDQLELNNTMIITDEGVNIPLDSVLKYYTDPTSLAFSSKTLIVVDRKSKLGAFKKAMKRYLYNDSIRKSKATR